VNFAEKNDIELIVIGTFGKTGVSGSYWEV
jgi:nucleotide-binding universal stress UspA family protein